MRVIEKLMGTWQFIGSDGKMTQVQLPHTWNGYDGQDGGNDYYRGTCTYLREFDKPNFRADQSVYLQFQGVNASAEVTLNGNKVCQHHNGYSTFRADVTDYLTEKNVLEVKVDNSVNDKVYPQKADFTFYGGIYRDVELVILSKTHFDMDYYGGPGMKYYTDVIDGDGYIYASAYLGEAAKAAGAQVAFGLYDHEGKLVCEGKGEETVLKVENVHLWDGLEDPYLYTLNAYLVKDGQLVDQISTKCGVRTFEFSPKDGFHLNGRPYPLHGVSRHQDRRDLGNAISYEMMDEDMDMILEIGANTVRLAHYQHNQYFYDLCDKYGMIVWAEIPYISEHMPGGRENTFEQMKELIVQNYNHPSIVTWGVSNEITISGRKHRKDMMDNHHELQKLCKEMDPTRVTTLACYAVCHPFHPVSKITDIVGWNLYLGWYVPGLFLNDLWIGFYHLIYPNRCLCYSEYGAEGMPNLHSSKPRRGDHSEEYQAKYHEYMLKCFERHPYMWASYVWNMFDFAADARDQGGEPGMNHKGLVTFDRKIKKDSFYLYKAWWSKEPFIHLCGKRYEYRPDAETEITVYSNQEEVSLFNNGKLIDRLRGEKVFKFKMKMEDVNEVVVKAGDYEDKAVIYKVSQPKPEYTVKKGNSQNWV